MEPDDIPEEGVPQRPFEAPPGSTRVLLVRHGASAPAHPDRVFPTRDGHSDPPLSDEGLVQAEQVGERLAALPVAGLYVTTLQRTHQTAAPLAARLGMDPVEIADLREVHLGEWEGGQFRIRAAQGDPLVHRVYTESRWDVVPGAESNESLAERTQRGLARVVAAHPDELVVVVVHGGVIGSLLAHASGARPLAFSGADNTSVSELVVIGERQLLRRFNDTSHLYRDTIHQFGF